MRGTPPGRKETDGAWLLALLPKGVIVMTDYEMLSLVVAIIMLVLAAMSFYKNDK